MIFESITDFWTLTTELIRSFEIRDLVDIVIVALLLYGLIKLVRDTRSGQLVKGLLLCVLAYFVSSFLGLTMLNSMLQYFFQFAFIAILVLFQPEIRKALEQMGRSNVGKSVLNAVNIKDNDNNNDDIENAINCVGEAFVQLQKQKMGALVVFERKTRLGEIIETGTIINAKPSTKLIANIFFNKAPLHDGAVVIRDGNVYSAGCILPLTNNDTINESVGTRHRAALGMSEDSDAVVAILSEETGQFSIAKSGELKRNYTKESLKIALADILIEKTETTNTGNKKRNLSIRSKSKKEKQD